MSATFRPDFSLSRTVPPFAASTKGAENPVARVGASSRAAAEAGEDVAEQVSRIEPAIAAEAAEPAERRAVAALGVDLAPVEPGALLRVAQQVPGRGGLLEARLGPGVARIPVRVVVLDDAPIGPLQRLDVGVPGAAENRIGVAHQAAG